jgi:hypothetical protein
VSGLGRWPRILGLVASGLLAPSVASPGDAYRPEDFRTTSVFELVVESFGVLRPGPSRIAAKSAVATRVRGLTSGNSAGLEILFVSEPITQTSHADAVLRQARDLRKRDHAGLVLYVDAQGKIWQVNLEYVVPGTTVSRTIAWKPEELQQFSRSTLDGTRLTLRSKGLYRESGGERFTLSWDVDVSVPVIDPAKP